MKTNLKIISKAFIIALSVILLNSCASTTVIQSEPGAAKVYLNDELVGQTPYSMTDTKIVGTCTLVKLEKEGYKTLNTSICRTEQVDVGAVIGGLFVWIPFAWAMKYNPTHTYQLLPLQETETVLPYSLTSKLKELKALLDEGIITQEEFEKAKKKLLEE
ncbi:MAG: PEGA domain-containing protein [Chlorobi bacterium]|nr:PEGA domain-containing protein [Chlorobiota bacterium]